VSTAAAQLLARAPTSDAPVSSPNPRSFPIPPADPRNPGQVISWLEDRYRKGLEVRPDWRPKLNLSYFFGAQYVKRETFLRSSRTVTTRRAKRRNRPVRVTANRLASLVEHAVGMFSPLLPETRPNSNNEDDQSAARAGTRITLHEAARVDWESISMEARFWAIICGWAYDFVAWDASLTQITHEPLPPYEVVIDPNSRRPDLSDARWGCRAIALTRDEAWERWGVDLSPSSGVQTLSDELSFVIELADSIGMSFERYRDYNNRVFVKQMWLRPSRAIPAGTVLTWCGNKLLEGIDPTTGQYVPYPNVARTSEGKLRHWLPFNQLNFFPGLIRREGRTWVDDEVSMQADYNDARSRFATIRRSLSPHMTYPMNSVDFSKVTTRIQGIPFNPSMPGTINLNLPDGRWATPLREALEWGASEMDQRAGLTEGGRGLEVKSGLSAAAILALQEAANRPFSIPAQNLAAFTRNVWWQHLQLVRKYWTSERAVRVDSQESGRVEVSYFLGTDLTEELDIHVSAEAALPRSKAAKIQFITEALDKGLIKDPRVYFRAVDLPEFGVLADVYDKAASQAQRENDQLIQGQQVPVRGYHVHATHLTEHMDLAMTRAYDEADPAVKATIDAHMYVHEEALALQQQGLRAAQIDLALNPGNMDAAAAMSLSPLTANTPGNVPPEAGAQPPIPPELLATLGAQMGGNTNGGGQNPAQPPGGMQTSMRALSGVGAPGEPGLPGNVPPPMG
jgi:hypothetical protein